MHVATGCKVATSPSASGPRPQVKKKRAGAKAKGTRWLGLSFLQMFFSFRAKISVFTSLPKRCYRATVTPCCIDEEEVSWLGQSTRNVCCVSNSGWNSFFRSLFSRGCLIVFWGASEASSSSLSVSSEFTISCTHGMPHTQLASESCFSTDWLGRIVFQEGHGQGRASETGDAGETHQDHSTCSWGIQLKPCKFRPLGRAGPTVRQLVCPTTGVRGKRYEVSLYLFLSSHWGLSIERKRLRRS